MVGKCVCVRCVCLCVCVGNEWYLEKAEEKRRVAEGREGASDVGYEKDKVDKDVGPVGAPGVCTDEGADEEEGGACGSDPGGD